MLSNAIFNHLGRLTNCKNLLIISNRLAAHVIGVVVTELFIIEKLFSLFKLGLPVLNVQSRNVCVLNLAIILQKQFHHMINNFLLKLRLLWCNHVLRIHIRPQLLGWSIATATATSIFSFCATLVSNWDILSLLYSFRLVIIIVLHVCL
jgi:hypothetical protein